MDQRDDRRRPAYDQVDDQHAGGWALLGLGLLAASAFFACALVAYLLFQIARP